MSYGRFITWLALVASFVALATVGIGFYLLDKETNERRDAACRGAEAGYAQEVHDLERTYRILKDPPPIYRELLKNPIVREDLRETIRSASNDEDRFGVFVSPFCDDPGIGLAEPDPVLPPRPHSFNP